MAGRPTPNIKLTDAELERRNARDKRCILALHLTFLMAIEELVKESSSQPGNHKRKRLDVAAHRMLLNSLSTSNSKRPRGTNQQEQSDQERTYFSNSKETLHSSNSNNTMRSKSRKPS